MVMVFLHNNRTLTKIDCTDKDLILTYFTNELRIGSYSVLTVFTLRSNPPESC